MKFKIVLIICISVWFSSGAQTFSSSPNQIIPDYPTIVSFTIAVSGLPNSIDSAFGLEQVCIQADHTYDSNLEVSLTAPDGTAFTLFTGVGGSGDNFTNTCLRKDATNWAIYYYTAPFTGTYVPMGDMGLLNNGQNPNGIWTITFQDNAWNDTGWLYDWSITFGSNPAEPTEAPGSTLPVIKLTIDQSIPNDPKAQAYMQIVNKGSGQLNYFADTVYEYESNVMIELQGFTGPYFPKKNYDFDLIDTMGNKTDAPLLGMPAENDWIIKSEYLDHTLMYNTIAFEFYRRLGRYAPRTRSFELYLNGIYHGVFTLMEKVKQDSVRVDIDELDADDTSGIELTGGYIIEMNANYQPWDWYSPYLPINIATSGAYVQFKHVDPKSEVIQPQQHDYIRAWVDSFEYSLHQPYFQDPQNGFRKWAKEESFIDLLLLNELGSNLDAYDRSTYLYKEKNTEDGLLHIGPPWDFDRSFYNIDYWLWQSPNPYWAMPDWWDIFHTDSIFLKKEWCRWNSLRNDVFATDSFMAFIDSLHLVLDGAAQRNFAKWTELGVNDWDQIVLDLQFNLTDRLTWMDINLLPPAGVLLPVVSLSDTTFCEGDILSGNIGSNYDYEWNTGAQTPEILVNQSGMYSLTVEGDYGCYAVDEAEVTVLPAPLPTFVAQTGNNNLHWNFFPDFTNGINYQWNFGDGSSSNIMQPDHNYSSAGNYVVSLDETFANNCDNMFSDTISVWGVGIAEVETLVRVYPNPATTQLFLESPYRISSVIIHDLIGKEILRMEELDGQKISLSLDGISDGVYLITIKTTDGESIRKFVSSK